MNLSQCSAPHSKNHNLKHNRIVRMINLLSSAGTQRSAIILNEKAQITPSLLGVVPVPAKSL